jgi:protein required for attachment to host cells
MIFSSCRLAKPLARPIRRKGQCRSCNVIARDRAGRRFRIGKEITTVITWILVSDISRAKLFSAENREDDWALVKEFEHPEGREFSKDIRPSSPPGRMQKSKGVGARSAVEPRTWPKEAEAERFAEQLATYLDEALAKRAFEALVLVAPPHFLGMLHGTLGKQTAKHLKATVDKDLAMFDATEIRERLLNVTFPPKSTTGKG